MTYSNDGRSRQTRRREPASTSSRQYASGNRPITMGGSYHGPRGTRTRPNPGLRAGRGGRGQGGYPLKSRNINFQGGRGRIMGLDRRLLILGALAVVLVILVVVGVSSCVRGCSSEQPASEANPVDARVAAGVSEDVTKKLAAQLNQNEAFTKIAANASAYADQGLLDLALNTPEAIDFVAAYPEAEKSAQPYEDTVEKGTAPQLFCWDARWGNVDYAGHPFALTGSGPTSLAMAYMGLTGKSDISPADLAAKAAEGGQTGGDSAMLASFIEDSASDLGLSVTAYTSNADNLSQMLEAGTYLLVEAKAGTLTDAAHWVLLVSEDEGGAVTVYDPTSPEVSSRPWDPTTLAGATDSLYAVSLTEAEGDGETAQQ